jgi:hypothetical protein
VNTVKKLGRRAALHTRRTMVSALALQRALAPLGAPPGVSDDYVAAVDKVTGGDWGMCLNDSLGDCVIADSAHQVMLHTANGGGIVTPSDQDCLAMYVAVGGYNPNAALVNGENPTDQGCVEVDACQYLQSTGLCGQKSAGTGSVDPANLDHLRWAVQLFGACRLGITVTQSMMDDTDAGNPWTRASGAVLGGHDVPIVKYDAQFAYVVTWGKLQAVAWGLVAEQSFLDEAHAEVWPDFVTAAGTAPNGFDLPALLAALPALVVSS